MFDYDGIGFGFRIEELGGIPNYPPRPNAEADDITLQDLPNPFYHQQLRKLRLKY